jgi:hypothetical protein
MNRFATSALAVATLGSAAWAGTGDSDWLELDQEITSLTSSVAMTDGPQLGAMLRLYWLQTGDDVFGLAGPGDDVSGLDIYDALFWIEATSGDYSARVSGDLSTNTALTEDAYIRWLCGEDLQVTWGRFKPYMGRSSQIDAEHLFFADRTLMGMRYDSRSEGIAVNGSMDQFVWNASVTNGVDGLADEYEIVLHGGMTIGNGAGWSERQTGDGTNAFFGATYYTDGFDGPAGDLGGFLLEASGNMDQFWFAAEFASLDEGSSNTFDAFLGGGGDGDDNSPYSFAIGMDFNDEFGGGVRFQDGDDELGTSAIQVAGNYRCNGATWVLDWTDFENDVDDGSLIRLGVNFGSSRSRADGNPW